MPSHPELDDDIPTGVHHLPQGSQIWAVGITKDVRAMKPIVEEIHSDFKEAKVFLKTLRWILPVSVGVAIGVVNLLSWALSHVKL